jgi:hypothetical protein
MCLAMATTISTGTAVTGGLVFPIVGGGGDDGVGGV